MNPNLNELVQYCYDHTDRTSCVCGNCIDSGKAKGEPIQSVDLTVFKVGLNNRRVTTKDELLARIQQACPELLDGNEHSYIELGGLLGSQEAALLLIGLGHLLGLWKALEPQHHNAISAGSYQTAAGRSGTDKPASGEVMKSTKDNSPNAHKWLIRHYLYSYPLGYWAMIKLKPNDTCRTMWLKCPDALWLDSLTRKLVTHDSYRPVRDWFNEQNSWPNANRYRAKCAEFGCYRKVV